MISSVSCKFWIFTYKFSTFSILLCDPTSHNPTCWDVLRLKNTKTTRDWRQSRTKRSAHWDLHGLLDCFMSTSEGYQEILVILTDVYNHQGRNSSSNLPPQQKSNRIANNKNLPPKILEFPKVTTLVILPQEPSTYIFIANTDTWRFLLDNETHCNLG